MDQALVVQMPRNLGTQGDSFVNQMDGSVDVAGTTAGPSCRACARARKGRA